MAGAGPGLDGYTKPNTATRTRARGEIAMRDWMKRQQVEGELTVTAAGSKGKRSNIGKGSRPEVEGLESEEWTANCGNTII